MDGVFEFLQGSEYAALEPFLCEVGEEALDGIEPEGGCWDEVEDEAWMFPDLFRDLGVLVDGIVIDDDMDRLVLRHPGAN